MRRERVKSSSVAAVGYDEATNILEVELHSKKAYRYFNVPPAAHEGLVRAHSIGRNFNERIRPRYRGVPIRD